MPNDKATWCPFEIEHHGKVIICEGCGEYERTVHEFENPSAQKDWRRDWCTCWCFRGCPYFNATMDFKYPEEQDFLGWR